MPGEIEQMHEKLMPRRGWDMYGQVAWRPTK